MGMTFSTAPSGGAAFSSVPADITAGGTELCVCAADSRAARTYTGLEGTGDYGTVADAVAALMSTWDPALDLWQVSLDSLGTATVGASDAITTTDTDLHCAWASAPFAIGARR